jgi:hypothetical protein
MYKVLSLGVLLAAAFAAQGVAAERPAKGPLVRSVGSLEPTSTRSYRYRPHARTFAGRRIGFYSYSYRDVINTYGDARSRYGSINSYRDPYVDRQTPSGPFDHGFFFDSGILPRGGNSPYLR